MDYKTTHGSVVLRRPDSTQTVLDPYLGTWLNTQGVNDTCLHVVRESDGKLNGWVETSLSLTRVQTASCTEPESFARLGEMTKVERKAADQLTVTFSRYTGMCCPRIAELHLAPDGNQLQGSFVAGPISWPHPQAGGVLSRAAQKSSSDTVEGSHVRKTASRTGA
jgi:hypothetical protein